MPDDEEVTFSDAAKSELTQLSDEAKNLILHTIHSAVGEVVGDVQIVRAHVLAIGQRFGGYFGAAKAEVQAVVDLEKEALKSQLATMGTDLSVAQSKVEALTAQVNTLTQQLAAVPTPAVPLEVPPAPAPADSAQPAEANVPAPDAPATPPAA